MNCRAAGVLAVFSLVCSVASCRSTPEDVDGSHGHVDSGLNGEASGTASDAGLPPCERDAASATSLPDGALAPSCEPRGEADAGGPGRSVRGAVDAARLGDACDVRTACSGGRQCVVFEPVDPAVVGGRCVDAGDPCAPVTCPSSSRCSVLSSLPSVVVCETL